MSDERFEIRRQNLRQYILDKYEGNRAAFSRAAGVHQNHTNLLLTDNETHRRNLGEALARRLESSLGLPDGWLDAQHSKDATKSSIILAADSGDDLSNVLRRDDVFASLTVLQPLIDQIPRLTAPENLSVYTVVSQDLMPEIRQGDHVLVDRGVKAVSGDGVYILARGADLYLRRMAKLLSGGWTIKGGPEGAATLENLKGLRAVGAIVAKLEISIV